MEELLALLIPQLLGSKLNEKTRKTLGILSFASGFANAGGVSGESGAMIKNPVSGTIEQSPIGFKEQVGAGMDYSKSPLKGLDSWIKSSPKESIAQTQPEKDTLLKFMDEYTLADSKWFNGIFNLEDMLKHYGVGQ